MIHADCTEACEAEVRCTVCKLRKAPRGRSVAMEAASSYCHMDCTGYWQDPQPGHLWPGELAQSREATLRSLTVAMLDEMARNGWWLRGERRTDLPTAWDINCGQCDAWAERAATLVGGAPVWIDSMEVGSAEVDAHCVLSLGGRFYDSQHPAGVDDVKAMDVVRGIRREEFIARSGAERMTAHDC